jgi:ketosteroid isomerase-like protein
MGTRHDDARVQRVIDGFEQLAPDALDRLGEFYAPDARFKDPFNEVQGLAPIRAIFAHMYVALREPRFVVHTAVVQGEDCFLTWDFLFAFRSGPPVTQRVRGATHLRFGADGLIVEHRDYWDVAEELYEKLPLLGTLMRWLKRRAGS